MPSPAVASRRRASALLWALVLLAFVGMTSFGHKAAHAAPPDDTPPGCTYYNDPSQPAWECQNDEGDSSSCEPSDAPDFNYYCTLPSDFDNDIAIASPAASDTPPYGDSFVPDVTTDDAEEFTITGSGSGCSVAPDGTVTITSGSGSCTINVDQAGDSTYLGGSTTVTFSTSKAAQAITYTSSPPSGATAGSGTYTPTATGGASGQAVTFSLDPSSSGCTMSGATVTFSAAGTCVIDANQTGTTNYAQATQQQQSFAIAQGSGPTLPFPVSTPTSAPTPASPASPTPTPSPTPSAQPSPSPSATGSASPTPSSSPSPTTTATTTGTASASPRPTATPTPSPSPRTTPVVVTLDNGQTLSLGNILATPTPSTDDSATSSSTQQSTSPTSTSGKPGGSGPGGNGHATATTSTSSSRHHPPRYKLSSIATSLHRPSQMSFSLKTIGTNLLLVLLMIMLLGTPPELINDTWGEHYVDIIGWAPQSVQPWLRRHTRDPKDPDKTAFKRLSQIRAWHRAVLFVVMAIAAAIIYGFLDPHYGFDLASVCSVISLAVAMLALTAAWELPAIWWLHRRSSERLILRIFPAVIPVSVICVVASRLLHLSPGFLIGSVAAAAAIEGEAKADDEGPGILACSLAVLGLAAVAWIAWIPVDAHITKLPDPGFWLTFVDTVLATLTVSGLQMLIFGLLPLRFVKGSGLREWSFAAWASVYATAMLAVVWLIAHPKGGPSQDIIPSVKTLLPFLIIGGVGAAIWLYTRLHPEIEEAIEEAEEAVDRLEDSIGDAVDEALDGLGLDLGQPDPTLPSLQPE